MDLLETIKSIVAAHDEADRYQPVHISYPSWEEPGPLFATREEAQAWLDRQIARGRKGDWGYVTVARTQPPSESGGGAKETLEDAE